MIQYQVFSTINRCLGYCLCSQRSRLPNLDLDPSIVPTWVLNQSITLMILLSLPLLAQADNITDHTQQLRQQSQQAIHTQQQSIIDAATPDSSSSTSPAVDVVSDQDSKLPSLPQPQQISPETALFMMINQNNWGLLRQLIAAYSKLETADPDMLLFAKAALAAGEGQVKDAIDQYERLLTSQPQFVRARLDLARLYYKDELVAEAKAEFERLKDNKDLPKSVIRNIDAYLTAIDDKQSLNGTFSLALGQAFNINESSETSTCLFELPNGECGFERTTPDAINSAAVSYELTANKDWQIYGHHGINVSVLGYGTGYLEKEAHDNEDTTINASVGYRYHDFDTQLSIAPMYEYHRENQQKQYDANGIRIAINQNLSNSSLGKWLKRPLRGSLSAEYKDFNYVEDYASNDGRQLSLYSSLAFTTTPRSQWFGNFHYIDRDNQFAANTYHQTGIAIGHRQHWTNGLLSSIQLQHNWRDYQGFNALLNATRKDKQSSLSATLQSANWAWRGFNPILTYQYRHNDSNIDWLYDYDSSEIWLKLNTVW